MPTRLAGWEPAWNLVMPKKGSGFASSYLVGGATPKSKTTRVANAHTKPTYVGFSCYESTEKKMKKLFVKS